MAAPDIEAGERIQRCLQNAQQGCLDRVKMADQYQPPGVDCTDRAFARTRAAATFTILSPQGARVLPRASFQRAPSQIASSSVDEEAACSSARSA